MNKVIFGVVTIIVIATLVFYFNRNLLKSFTTSLKVLPKTTKSIVVSPVPTPEGKENQGVPTNNILPKTGI